MTTAAVLLISALQLGAAAALVLRKSADVAELKAESERLTALSETDELTGLLNRRAYLRMARDVYPTEKSLGVIVFNIDSLGDINRSFGHAEGDKLIRHFGIALKNMETLTTKVFRLSGDEFLLIAEGGDEALLSSILTRLELHLYPETLASPVKVSASHGCACGKGCELQRLVDTAERALYNSRS